MNTREPDSVVETLDDHALRARLARTDWEHDPLFIPDEQVLRMFRRARAIGDKPRIGLFTYVFSQRLLIRSRKFVLKTGIFPDFIDDLRRAADELASYIWEHLISSDAAHAEKAFGQFFERRAIDFLRSFLAKKRKLQSSLDSHEEDEDEVVNAIDDLDELKDFNTPELLATRKQEFERVNSRLLGILSQKEYATYTLLYCADWQIQEIAEALQVTVKSVNTYKNSALAKIDKEFKQ